MLWQVPNQHLSQNISQEHVATDPLRASTCVLAGVKSTPSPERFAKNTYPQNTTVSILNLARRNARSDKYTYVYQKIKKTYIYIHIEYIYIYIYGYVYIYIYVNHKCIRSVLTAALCTIQHQFRNRVCFCMLGTWGEHGGNTKGPTGEHSA